jgi:phage-related protein
MDRPMRPLKWVGSSRKDYAAFPPALQERCGFALFLAQLGQYPPNAKPLKSFGGGVVALVERFDGDAYRAVYVTRLTTAVYVLHAFKKKSKSGIGTPQQDIDLIRQRLRDAEADDRSRQATKG